MLPLCKYNFQEPDEEELEYFSDWPKKIKKKLNSIVELWSFGFYGLNENLSSLLFKIY